MTSNYVNSESYSEEEWLNMLFLKSESENSRKAGKTAMNLFDLFCKDQEMTRDEMVQKYCNYLGKDRPDVKSVCMSLNKFVAFLSQDREEIIMKGLSSRKFKKKSPSSIKGYFSFVKSYLRICGDVRITGEDVKDYITFPKRIKIPRRPITIQQIKEICNNSSQRRKALYYVLITSGMRLGEALQLKKSDIHTKESPVRIVIRAKTTKTREQRETYITAEAYDKLVPILETKEDDEFIFKRKDKSVINQVVLEEKVIGNLREKLGMTEKYEDGVRYVVAIHSFRAYFHTKASNRHGTEYANALDGHTGYLEQYYRLEPQERASKYLELEQDLLIESIIPSRDKAKDQKIALLETKVAELQIEFDRMRLSNPSQVAMI